MDDRNIIRQRIIDRAADLFSKKNPNGGGLFTTAHYGQAIKAEFKTPGPTLDGETCTKHLLEMGDIVEKAGGNLWRRKGAGGAAEVILREGRRTAEVHTQNDTIDSETHCEDDSCFCPACVEIRVAASRIEIENEWQALESEVEREIIDILSDQSKFLGVDVTTWWTVGLMAATLHHIEENNDLGDGLLENIVGIVLYTMAVDGRVISQPNMLVDGTRTTTFTLAPKSVDVDDMQPPFEGSPDDEGFDRSL